MIKIRMASGTSTTALLLLICLLAALCYLVLLPNSGSSKLDKSLDIPLSKTVQSSSPMKPKTVQTAEDCNKEFDYKGRAHDDPELINYIRTLFTPPSVKAYKLNAPQNRYFTFEDQSKYVDDLHGPGRRDGTFLEVGGYDGEHGSLTLFLEREKGFSGLLIEANPENYKTLLAKERKCFSLNAALSPTNTSGELYFTGTGQQGKLSDVETASTIKVKAFPLDSIMKAFGVDFIDFFNLDIEGFEYKILKTIPFDKLKFGIVVVEHMNIPEPHDEVVKFMEDRGFKKVLQNGYDWLFVDPNYEKKFKEGKQ